MGESSTGAGPAVLAPGDAALAAHEGLVRWVVRQQGRSALPWADALHAGRVGLWQALRGYDPTRGTQFSTYAVSAIRHAVWAAVATARPPAGPAAPPAPLAAPTAEQKRAQQPLLAATWALAVLAPQLPLRFPLTGPPPPVPKARYRSAYVPPDPAALAGVDLATLGDGELAL